MATVTNFDLDATASGLNGTTSYTEGAAATLLSPRAIVTATGNFNGQTLVISGLLAEDQIGFANGVTISGHGILIGNKTIGTFSGGTSGSDLVVTFNSNATADRVQTFLRNLTFLDSSDAPIPNQALSFNLAGSTRTEVVTVIPTNDAPVLDLNGVANGSNATVSFLEQTAIVIAPAAVLSDPDSANLTSLTLTLKQRPDGTAESLSLNAAAAAAAAGLTITPYNPNTGQLTISGSASKATYQTILQGITYNNASDNPLTTGRTVQVAVSDGAASSVVQTANISITPVNDAPVLDLNGNAGAGTAGAISYAIGNPVTKIASLGTVFDADSANFSGGSLHVAFTENGTATDQLKIVTDAIVTLTGAGGTTIKVNGTSIGTWSGGSNGTDLVISFNNASTPAAVETLIKHIGYANSSASPSTLTREVTFTVNDGDGSANGGSNIGLATATISYNHAPTAVAFANTTPIIAENSDTSSHLKVADIVVTDDGLGTNALTLAGADAAAFEIVGNSLYLKAGTALDFEIKSSYSVAVKVDDPSVGSNPDATSPTFTLTVSNINEAPHLTTIPASGSADANIPLNITVEAVDAVGTLEQVKISGVPSVYTLTAGAEVDAAGEWLVSVSDLPGLALTPIGTATAGEFTLHVVATSVDGASTASTSADLSVTVNAGANQHSGFVIDGYIAGATVFADANGNGVLDPGEAFATTNADGSFTLTGGFGPLVVSGGTDVSTGLPFEGVLSAPAGSTVMTPLTTLVVLLAPSMEGATPEEKLAAAQNAVIAAFNLDPGIDLQTFNPVPLALSGDSAATDVLSAAIQVQSMVTQISVVSGSSGDVFTEIANTIATAQGGVVDLSAAVGSVASAAGIVDPNTLSVLTDVVTAAIQSIQQAADVTELAQAAKVAQGDAADALAATDFSNPDDVSSLRQTYITELSTQIDIAQIGDVGGAQVGTLGDDILTGGSGVDAIGGLDGRDRIDGGAGNDMLYGDAGYDTFIGGAGNDLLDGGSELDRALYTDATGPINVNLAEGSVSGAGVGIDTLVSVEQIRGSSSDDSYTAVGYTGGSPIGSVAATYNEFEGMAGNDVITGNGDTALSYLNATAGVTVHFTSWVVGQGATGTATGDASVGTDSFTGVRIVRGSEFADQMYGSNNPAGTVEVFQGRGGNDFIDGGGGFDRVLYYFRTDDNITAGLNINMAAGTVVGDASVGTDTLRSIESMRGSNFDDTYNATGFSASSTNAGSNGTFNSFEGLGGNDTITGNGNTRIEYINATAAVNVDFTSWVVGQGATGTAIGDASVGHDSFTGVNWVTGSYFADTLSGSDNLIFTTETFQGGPGDDTIDGSGGFDIAVYNTELGTTKGIEVTPTIAGDVFQVAGDASIGTDLLTNIESVRGTNFADIFDGADYNGTSADVNATTFSEFEGMGGDDTITGNGLTGLAGTRITYVSATGGVTVDIAAGTAIGDASVGTDHFTDVLNVRGSGFADTLSGNAENNILEGQGGFDQVLYDNAAGGISVNMAAGTVSGDPSVGTDTLRSIEAIQGTNDNDTYNATGFSGSSTNVGSSGTLNEFEGLGGDDSITGNGNTRISYINATDGVTVDLSLPSGVAGSTGSAHGTAGAVAGIGIDSIFGGVNSIVGSNFADALSGDANNNTFDGRGGNDTINGGGGIDLAVYNADIGSVAAISVNVAAGTVVRGSETDTLISIESVRGTNSNDTYNASGFVGPNEFEGMGGDDTITGDGNIQLTYQTATSGVTVDMALGKATGDASVGTDTFNGVNSIVGSQFGDTLLGDANDNTLDGRFANDVLNGRGGNDQLFGRLGADTFVYADNGGADVVNDFSHDQGDKIDLTGVGGVTSLADVQAIASTSQNGVNTVIDFGSGNTLTLNNVTLTNLVANDFIFHV